MMNPPLSVPTSLAERVGYIQRKARKKRLLQIVSLSVTIVEFALYLLLFEALFRWKMDTSLTIKYIYLFALQIFLFSIFAAKKGLFRLQSPYGWVEELFQIVQVVFYTFMMTIGILFLLKQSAEYSRVILLFYFSGMVLVAWSTHLLRRGLVTWLTYKGSFVRKALIIGAGRIGQKLADHLQTSKGSGYQLVGFLDDYKKGPDIKGTLQDMKRIIHHHDVDEVFITIPSARERIHQLLHDTLSYNIRVKIVPELYDIMTTKVSFEQLDTFPLVELKNNMQREGIQGIKRALDVVLSVTFLLIFSPLILLLAVLVRMDSPGPVIFKQQRVGVNGMPFYIYKFRTMIENAEERLKADPKLYKKYIQNNYKLAPDEDPRITKIGRWLRRTSLDELPQLINVLKGEMSLVGPRPVVLEELKEYGDRVQDLLTVKPGITGYWAATGRSEIGYPERINIELYYVYNQSLMLDLKILLKTVVCVVRRDGAY